MVGNREDMRCAVMERRCSLRKEDRRSATADRIDCLEGQPAIFIVLRGHLPLICLADALCTRFSTWSGERCAQRERDARDMYFRVHEWEKKKKKRGEVEVEQTGRQNASKYT